MSYQSERDLKATFRHRVNSAAKSWLRNTFALPRYRHRGLFDLVGPRALQPTNIAWLKNTDAMFQYLAWKFFAQIPWSIPFGINPKYGLEFSSSIFCSIRFRYSPCSSSSWACRETRSSVFRHLASGVFLPAVPHAAISFLSEITERARLRAIMATFFVFAPIMVRVYGHYALVGQFLVLFALYLNLIDREGPSLIAWPLLIATAALTHAYLLAMVCRCGAATSSGAFTAWTR